MLYILRTEKMEMSQQQVADLLNIDRSTYGYYELGKTQPPYRVLIKLKKLYDVTYDELFEPEQFIKAKRKGRLTMIPHMTNSEEQVMRLLWQSNRPLTCIEIVKLSKDKTWKDSYVHSIIKSLMKKGIVEIGSFELVSRSYARKFVPKISYDEYVLLSSFSESELKDCNRMTRFFRVLWSISGSGKMRESIDEVIS